MSLPRPNRYYEPEMKLRHDALLGAVVAALACGLLVFLPAEMSPDGWYALLGGDIIVHHGLPHHDWLTVWGSGREWVDQQWLAQLVYYGLYSLGGLRLALLANAAIVVAAFGLAVRLAGNGSTSREMLMFVSTLSGATVGLNGSALRPQTLALPLFVVLTWLLIDGSRASSNRLYLTIPVLVLWANVHGSVTLGLLLLLLFVATSVWRRQSVARVATVGALGVVSLFTTPYAGQVAGYYRTILFNSEFSRYLPDWGPTSLTLQTVSFYALAVASVVVLARTWRSFSPFERTALLLLIAVALEARRGMIWFALFAVMVIPRGGAAFHFPNISITSRIPRRALATATIVLPVAAGVIAGSRPSSWFSSSYPPAAAREIGRAAGHSGQVFANGAYADWLLLVEPKLRGRIAYDARVEILPRGRLADAAAISIGRWNASTILRGYDVLVLRPQEDELRDQVVGRGGWRPIRADAKIVVLSRSSGA